MTKAHTNTVDPGEVDDPAKRDLDLADADRVRAFELALVGRAVAERHISWGFVRGCVDPVDFPDIFVRIHECSCAAP